MKSPRISVALGTFNGARHLGALVDSLLAQRDADLEVVAVDDASTDGSMAILRAAAARDSRIRIVGNLRNLGYNINFTRAFAQCRGELVAPCDQDDVWHPDKLSALAAALGDADLVYCDSEYIDEAGRPTGRRVSDGRHMYQGTDPLALVATNSASGHAQLFRSEMLRRAEPFPEGVDYDWWLAIVAAAGRGMRYLDRPLVQFRRHDAAASGIGRASAPPRVREYLEGRRRLLRAVTRLDGPRRPDVEALAQALERGLDHGEWTGCARLAWRHRRPLTAILGPGLPALARRLLSPTAQVP